MDAETWLPVADFEAEYEVSSLGQVRSVRRQLLTSRGHYRPYGGKVLAQNLSGPRALVTLSKHNVVSTHAVHLLVCRAFHGPKPIDKDVAAHWDGDGFNNREDNLRWATFVENEEDKRRHDRHGAGERNPSVKLTAAQVAEIRARYVKRYGAGAALAREFGVSNTQLHDIVHAKGWSEEGNAKRRAARGQRREDPFAAACLKQFGAPSPALRAWGLRPGDVDFIALLLRHDVVTHAIAVEALYGNAPRTPQAVGSRLYGLRKRLTPQGFVICSSNAGGVWLTAETAERLRAAIGIPPHQHPEERAYAHAA